MKSAIGIMGGTFNPFHNGHLQLALQAYRQFELSKVLVMPSGTPAHKSTKELIAHHTAVKWYPEPLQIIPIWSCRF